MEYFYHLFRLINVGGGKENENGVAIMGKLNLQSGTNNSDKLLQITVIPETPCLQVRCVVLLHTGLIHYFVFMNKRKQFAYSNTHVH